MLGILYHCRRGNCIFDQLSPYTLQDTVKSGYATKTISRLSVMEFAIYWHEHIASGIASRCTNSFCFLVRHAHYDFIMINKWQSESDAQLCVIYVYDNYNLQS